MKNSSDNYYNSKIELFKQIWKIAEELRGKVDGWDFKGYVLGFLFYRYISENINKYINKFEANNFDLSISKYVEPKIIEEIIDIKASKRNRRNNQESRSIENRNWFDC